MKGWVALFLSLTVVAFVNQAFAADVIRMGYFMLPPLQYTIDDSTSPVGASIVYFEALASKMAYTVEWVGPLPLLRLSKQLKAGEVDGTVGFPKNYRLEAFLYYTNKSIFLAQPTIMVRKNNKLTSIRSIEDIRGYHIGLNVSIADIYTPLLDEHRNVIKLEPLGGEHWVEQNLKKLIAGRIDAIYDRHPFTMLFIAARQNVDDQIRVLPVPDPPTPMYVVFSKASKQGRELLEHCNAVISQIDIDHDELVNKELDAVAQQP